MFEKEVYYRLAKWLLLNMEKDGVVSSNEMRLALLATHRCRKAAK